MPDAVSHQIPKGAHEKPPVSGQPQALLLWPNLQFYLVYIIQSLIIIIRRTFPQ